jgi:hypothetical protein
MSRRSVPRIAPADLRDHAEEARIDRVWARIDADLPAVAPAASRRPVLAYLAIAAAFSAFAGGIFVGKVAFQGPVPTAIAPVQSSERTTVDVLAAGSEGRSFPLPGGGQLMLQPGATVEVEHAGASLTLKLLHGAASVDTADAQRVAGLMIVAGDAQLNTQAGSVINVNRNQDDIDVSVSDGSVSITSPAGTQKLGRGGQAHAVPIHSATAALSPTSSPAVRAPLLNAHGQRPSPPRVGGKPASVEGPAWLTSYANNDDTTALALLRQQPGGLAGAIANARTAHELMAISTIAGGKEGEPAAVIDAFKSVVDRFPEDVNAQMAALSLARIYQAAKQADLATAYLERANKLTGPLAEDALCRRIKGERLAGHKDEAVRQAKEYVAKYPDGRCKDEVELALEGDDGAGGSPPAAAPPANPGVAAPAPSGSAAP